MPCRLPPCWTTDRDHADPMRDCGGVGGPIRAQVACAHRLLCKVPPVYCLGLTRDAPSSSEMENERLSGMSGSIAILKILSSYPDASDL